MRFRAAKRGQFAGTLTRDQRAQSLVHEGCLLLHSGDVPRFGQQVTVQKQGRTHMHKYGWQMHMRRGTMPLPRNPGSQPNSVRLLSMIGASAIAIRPYRLSDV